MWENVKLEKEDNIAILTIDRPKALNALNTKTLLELKEAIDFISRDKNIYVLIIKGGGDKAFVAGADIAEMKDMNSIDARNFAFLGQEIFRKIELLEIPVIAAVQGYALGGGCELAMACDIRIASTKAKFGQPEVGLGITPGFAGTQRLPRLIGVAKAKELIFTGEMITAEEALRLGLVNKVVEPERLMEEAMEMAKKIISKGQIAVRLAKSAINRGIETDIETGTAYESEVFSICFSTHDQKEGMSAFLEKRTPDFKIK